MSESNNNFGIGRGITITTGFDVAARLPLDARTVVNTKDDLSAIPDAVKYEGLLVFVVEENKLYQWKQELLTSGEFADEYSWGPIESEISARNVEDFSTLDFINTKSLHMQKNKVDFFPITHERFVFNDNGESLYETNAKLDEAIEDFQNRVDQAIKDWNEQVLDMQAKTEADLNSMKQELEAEIDALLKELNDKSNEMDETFAEKIEEINKQIAELQAKIEADVDAMLKDVDNSILSDNQINDLLRQINENLALLEEDGSGSTIATSFETYEATVVVNTAVTEVSLAGLGTIVNPGDKLFVHLNSVYLVENVDYRIDTSAQKIVCLTEQWNSYNIAGCEFAFDLIKITTSVAPIDNNGVMTISSGTFDTFKTYEAVVVVNTAVTEVSLADLGTIVNPGDKLFVHLNSVYLVENVDYRIDASAEKIVCLTGQWNSHNIAGCEFAFDLIKK